MHGCMDRQMDRWYWYYIKGTYIPKLFQSVFLHKTLRIEGMDLRLWIRINSEGSYRVEDWDIGHGLFLFTGLKTLGLKYLDWLV